jgi:hypothetical protein
MPRALSSFGITLVACALATSAQASDLLVTESTNLRVMLFSSADGSLIDANYIDLGSASPSAATPMEAIEDEPSKGPTSTSIPIRPKSFIKSVLY